MKKAKIAGKSPLAIDLESDKNYAWCSCGLSSKQPLCDGSHKGTDFKPMVFKAEENKTVYLCVCKQTGNPGYCDGSHNQLS